MPELRLGRKRKAASKVSKVSKFGVLSGLCRVLQDVVEHFEEGDVAGLLRPAKKGQQAGRTHVKIIQSPASPKGSQLTGARHPGAHRIPSCVANSLVCSPRPQPSVVQLS